MKPLSILLMLLYASAISVAQQHGSTIIIPPDSTYHLPGGTTTVDLLVNDGTIVVDVAGSVINVTDSSPSAVSGTGKITGASFSMHRPLQQGATAPYQFESQGTSIQFLNTGTYPSGITMKVYPNTPAAPFFAVQAPTQIISHVNSATHVVTADTPFTHFSTIRPTAAVPTIIPARSNIRDRAPQSGGPAYVVDRVYDFTPEGTYSGVKYYLSIRYESSEFHGSDESQVRLYVSFPTNVPLLSINGLLILALFIIGTASWMLAKKRSRLTV